VPITKERFGAVLDAANHTSEYLINTIHQAYRTLGNPNYSTDEKLSLLGTLLHRPEFILLDELKLLQGETIKHELRFQRNEYERKRARTRRGRSPVGEAAGSWRKIDLIMLEEPEETETAVLQALRAQRERLEETLRSEPAPRGHTPSLGLALEGRQVIQCECDGFVNEFATYTAWHLHSQAESKANATRRTPFHSNQKESIT
jgi:hypothetical protein